MRKNVIDIDVNMFDAFGYELYERMEDQISNNWCIVIKDSNGKVLREINTMDDLNAYKKDMGIK